MSMQAGMDLMNQGGKYLDKKSFFGKATPDYDSARPLFEQAGIPLPLFISLFTWYLLALQFKAAKATDYAVEAYLKAADCYKKQDALFLAGKQVESAALLVQQQSKDMEQSAKLFKQASDLFIMYGSGEKGAECVEKAAKSLETVNIELAHSYYIDAISIYESEDKPRSGIDTIGRFISFLVRNKSWVPAVEYSDRLVQIYRKLDNHPSFNKQALTTTLIVLLSGDSVDARKKLIAYEDFQGFYDSDEGEICHHLVEAFETYDDELLANVLKRPNIRYLDNEIAKASQTLRIPGSGRSAPAAQAQQGFGGQQFQQLPPQQFQGGYTAPQGFQKLPQQYTPPQGFQQPQQVSQQFQPTPRSPQQNVTGAVPQGFQPPARSPTGSQQNLYGGIPSTASQTFRPPPRAPTGSPPNVYGGVPEGFQPSPRSPTGSQQNLYGGQPQQPAPNAFAQQPPPQQFYQPQPPQPTSGFNPDDDDDLC
ncbi:UNVERIFIED_CONTAM: hypothetical protein HDU68_009873 [Siphonaria sp. JEL0065]|nr:hypothetical protein HDU68_009873 [Siphonaria sp. JEL0065]